MVMELDHDLGEGTSASVNAQLNGNAPATHLMELEARAAEWPGGVLSTLSDTHNTAQAEHNASQLSDLSSILHSKMETVCYAIPAAVLHTVGINRLISSATDYHPT